jgi:hypothetical protein
LSGPLLDISVHLCDGSVEFIFCLLVGSSRLEFHYLLVSIVSSGFAFFFQSVHHIEHGLKNIHLVLFFISQFTTGLSNLGFKFGLLFGELFNFVVKFSGFLDEIVSLFNLILNELFLLMFHHFFALLLHLSGKAITSISNLLHSSFDLSHLLVVGGLSLSVGNRTSSSGH